MLGAMLVEKLVVAMAALMDVLKVEMMVDVNQLVA